MKRKLPWLATLAAVVGIPAFAADHVEAPGAQADPVADITDYYAFHDLAEGTVTLVLGVNGLAAAGDPRRSRSSKRIC